MCGSRRQVPAGCRRRVVRLDAALVIVIVVVAETVAAAVVETLSVAVVVEILIVVKVVVVVAEDGVETVAGLTLGRLHQQAWIEIEQKLFMLTSIQSNRTPRSKRKNIFS